MESLQPESIRILWNKGPNSEVISILANTEQHKWDQNSAQTLCLFTCKSLSTNFCAQLPNCCKQNCKRMKKKKKISYKYLSKWQSFSPIGWLFLIPLVFSKITPFMATSLCCIPADLIRNSAGIPRFNFLPEHEGSLPSKSKECSLRAQLSTLVASCLFILNDTLSILTWNS